MAAPISQKEYLKKYLGRKPGEKKKKKKKDFISKRITVIDDNVDLDLDVLNKNQDEDEDAPQIVAVIDERPPALRVDDNTKESLWIPIAPAKESIENKPLRTSSINIRRIEDKNKTLEKNFEQKSKQNHKNSSKRRSVSPKVNEDASPPRKRNDSDSSPPRKRRSEDLSPPRKSSQEDLSPPRGKKCEDLSPPRKRNKDLSPPRRRNHVLSPPRRGRDSSPPRRRRDNDSPSSRRNRDKFPTSSRRREELPSSRREERHTPPPREKATKTLEGKIAGLQNAQELAREAKDLKDRENKHFETISKELSGQNAATIVRDRKTGRVRNMQEEYERLRKKQEEEEKTKEKYSRWGRGLVQIENQEQKFQDQLKEMDKPLARYADDEDLEKYLKEQEREGDPMLAYIRKKKRKEAAKHGIVEKPAFEGMFMPNRYGIRPGHRWDGVDRSNGYEKKWFEKQNERTALQEESYKWSTEDM